MNLGVRQCFPVRRPWSLVKCLMWALVIFVQIHEHKGCLEEERIGLLRLKAFLKSHYHIGNRLSSWIEDTDQINSDCCGWEGISCNSTTGHVIELSLHDMKQQYYPRTDGFFYPISTIRKENIWLLNVSLFQPFKKLTSLDLSCNEIGGCIANEGFERLAVLRSLEVLNLAYNFFEDSILPSLTQLSSLTTLVLADNSHLGNWTTAAGSKSLSRLENLETLDISWTNFSWSAISSLSTAVKSSSLRNLNLACLTGFGMQGPLPAQELSAFENLERLDLSYNSLTDGLTPEEFHGLSKLSKLKHLDLSFNFFGKQIFRVLGAELPALESLNLGSSFYHMEGHLSIKEFHALSKLSKLKHLDLSYNFFGNQILGVLGALPALKSLNLRHNGIKGPLSIEDLANLSRLEILDMSVNPLNGSISPYIEALSSAKAISLSGNHFNGDFPTQDLCRLKKLEEFDISYNDFEGILPRCINNISSLRVLDISGNRFIGDLSSSLVASLNPTTIEYIDLSHNLFEGLFSFSSFANHSKLKVGRFYLQPENHINVYLIDVSGNHLDGRLQENIGKIMPNLGVLNISQNHLEGDLPSSVGDMSYLEVLDLSFNRFSGKVPTELVSKCTTMIILNLCNNNFQGEIFSKHFKLSALSMLQLNNNQFTGTLSSVLSTLDRIYLFDIGNNNMSGTIPSWIGNMTKHLSHNSLSGPIPSCLDELSTILLQGNKLTGSIPKALFNSYSLVALDVRENNLSGTIPIEISTFSNLRILLLGGNNFCGMIPNQVCLLKKIGIMDFSRNSFSGAIPHYIEVQFVTKYRSNSYKGGILDYMSGLDLSCNKLTGGIPVELGQLSSIRSLNLSYNQLTGLIPETFSSLASIESLDLSHNSLSGEIPSTLIDLNFMGTFSVAYNNLSGRVPDMKYQFGTFEKSSYVGNPFLCGPPLENGCTTANKSNPKPKKPSKDSERKWYEVDHVVFFASFLVSYLIFFLLVVSILYINPYWRQRCFNLIEDLMYWGYFTVLIPLKRLANRLYRH
ncbi:hypothetical protein I3842_07G045100 [Carya illinoinensis]|uniref:Leucine-rich repeat-containing N-terminal plant-type domain-containing protein n=1 Tax=Carya illinoinensis TaxID=32201 RepID=A0A922EG43_CARIL|nr:hypothetical protein I3842_07G045100 [Carya illinoinensis]